MRDRTGLPFGPCRPANSAKTRSLPISDCAITYSKDEATERQVLPFPHKPSPEEVAEHLLEWAEANLKPGHYSTGKLESDEPAELLLRRFGIVVTGIAEA